MTNDINEDKILMNPSDVCTLLGIKESTLRKYALILQNAGYHFHTNDKGQRGYFDRDVTVLRRFLEVKKSPDMTLEQSANTVIAWLEQSNVSLRDTGEIEENNRYNDDIKSMKETIDQQNKLLKELMKKMDQQQRYIDDKLNTRDQYLMSHIRSTQNLLESPNQLKAEMEEMKRAMNELLENQKKVAAAQEEGNKKGFWSKLFGK